MFIERCEQNKTVTLHANQSAALQVMTAPFGFSKFNLKEDQNIPNVN